MTTLGKSLDGTRGTVVFGNGTSALVGDISHTGSDDYLVVSGYVSGTSGEHQWSKDYVVPFGSFQYVRIDEYQGHDA